MKCISPLKLKANVVPCGKCNYCKQLRALDWCFRLSNELRHAPSGHFVTLTLRFLPQRGVSKRHLQLFFKRLRTRRNRKQIRYYAVAEYGARTLRPHYHAIIFGSTPNEIDRAWKLGHVHIGSVTPESIAYVSNYSLKGSRYPRGANRPFSLMSRRPAIGYRYLETHTTWHRGGQPPIDADTIFADSDVESFRGYTFVNGVRGHLPRFYRDRMFGKLERKLMNAINVAAADKQHAERVAKQMETGMTESEAFNYLIAKHRIEHDLLTKKFVENETI